MERSYLEFEKPIEEIKKQISQTLEIGDKGQVGIKETLKELREINFLKQQEKSLKISHPGKKYN